MTADTPQEYLLSYLQWLDADRAGLPDRYRARLEAALRRYGIPGLARTAALEEAVIWMFRSFSRVGDLVPVVTGILERRLRHLTELAPKEPSGGADRSSPAALLRARLDRLADATQGRHQVVADLARDVHFRYLDEPLLAAVIDAEYSTVDSSLTALRADPDRADRPAQIERLVRSPQPLRGSLLRHWRGGGDRGFREILLEVYTRRYYRDHGLTAPTCTELDRYLLCAAGCEMAGEQVHLVTAYAPLAELPALSRAVAVHLAGSVGPDRKVVVDVSTWRAGQRPDLDALARAPRDRPSSICVPST
jgi:hypothetical protein